MPIDRGILDCGVMGERKALDNSSVHPTSVIRSLDALVSHHSRFQPILKTGQRRLIVSQRSKCVPFSIIE
jgi:hypothetical protein